jgi:glutamate synthase (NADPH/NADH) small chain
VDVPAFVGAIARGDPGAAADTILAENLLGASCARVCPVEVLCQRDCVLVHDGREPIEIGSLQRYATDWALAHDRPLRRNRRRANGRRVAVIGAGPAGLVCAGELALLGYDVTVHDARPEPGGLVRYAIAPYRQVREPLPAEAEMLRRLGVKIRLGDAIDSPDALRRLETEADAIFLGIGMGEDVEVRVPGDDVAGVWRSLPFIEALKTGNPPQVGRRVVVFGGGNTAVDVAREAVRLGAEDVTLVYRRGEAEMPAYPHEVQEARDEGVQFRWWAAPRRFLGGNRLIVAVCVEMQIGPSGRPEPVPRSEFALRADTAVLAIGQQPRAELLGWVDGLELERGRPVVDPETGRTTNPRYFAGGDAVSGGATVVEAVRDAKVAARGIHELLRDRR